MKLGEMALQGAMIFVKRAMIVALVASPGVASADVPGEQVAEVTHLLDFVKSAACEMNRNGSYHSGEEAVAHIQKKYDYFRDEIRTTEDFIEYSATKSTMSDKLYTVRCGDAQEITTRDWLLTELKKYRASVGAAANTR